MVGDPGIEPGVRLREGVTVPCHTLRPVAHCSLERAHCLVQGEKHEVNLKFITLSKSVYPASKKRCFCRNYPVDAP